MEKVSKITEVSKVTECVAQDACEPLGACALQNVCEPQDMHMPQDECEPLGACALQNVCEPQRAAEQKDRCGAPAKRVALGLSGGVDSAVAVSVLQSQGYQVTGVTCIFVDDERTRQSVADAALVAQRFGIAHVVRDCTASFEEKVIGPFVTSYAAGLTPSPCVLCNATMKFPALAEVADELGISTIATGHYARLVDGAVALAFDETKDQSYMLSLVPRALLERVVFPLGDMTKAQVRNVAAELGLNVASKPDSQDVCFVPHDYKGFLAGRGVVSVPGDIVAVDGRVVGTHTGLADYTVGQRKGIGLAAPEPYYVVEKDAERNRLVVDFAKGAVMEGALVMLREEAAASLRARVGCELFVKMRYRQKMQPCIIESMEKQGHNVRVKVALREPSALTAEGQVAVFYVEGKVCAGGIISQVYRVHGE